MIENSRGFDGQLAGSRFARCNKQGDAPFEGNPPSPTFVEYRNTRTEAGYSAKEFNNDRKGNMKHEVEEIGPGATRERTGGKSAGISEADKQEMQKRMEAAGAPGPAHKALDALAGNWKAEVKCWMEPDGPPNISQGTATAKWTLNGRFLEEEFHGDMMGKPFTGRSLMGYDNIKQTFNTVWVSDMQTSMFCSEGKGDSGNKVITLEGKSSCAATGRKDITIKTVFRIISPDKHVFEMFDSSKANAKTMEITYTRK